jgi:hypothetical protein
MDATSSGDVTIRPQLPLCAFPRKQVVNLDAFDSTICTVHLGIRSRRRGTSSSTDGAESVGV